MADSKTTTTKTIAGGSLTTTPTERAVEHSYSRTNSEFMNNYGFAAIKSDGSVVAWGQNSFVPETLNGVIDVTQIYSNYDFFVALRTDGSVVPIGSQGINAETLKKLDGTVDVTSVSSTYYSFAALRADGSVVTWGNNKYGNNYGSDSSSIAKQLDGTIDVTKIYSNSYAFTALRADGSVVTWGNPSYGGNSSPVAKQLDGTIDVTSVVSGNTSFAAIRADGSVVTWGDSSSSNSSSVAKQLDGIIDVTSVVSNNNAFAAIRADGSVVTWGNSSSGGNSSVITETTVYYYSYREHGYFDKGTITSTYAPYTTYAPNSPYSAGGYQYTYISSGTSEISTPITKQLDGSIDVTSIISNNYAFAAIRTDGSVVTWGKGSNGGDSSAVAKQLDGTIDVTSIKSNGSAYAALRADGSVVTWGSSGNGGNSSSVAKQLDGTVDVTSIFANEGAFAAIRADGSVVTWGAAKFGGDSSAVATELNGNIDVKTISSIVNCYGTYGFAALRTDGSVVTWGSNLGTVPTGQLDGTIDVVELQSNGNAFSALRADGSVVTWGYSTQGGDSSAVKGSLSSGVEVFANVSTNDIYTAKDKVVPPEPPKPNAAGTLTIEGKATENETLTAINKITDVDGLGKISYQWLADGAAIIGAIQPTYVLSQMDVGKKVSVSAYYIDGKDTAENVISAAVTVANVNDLPKGTVSMTGTAAKGLTLTASNNLTDADGMGVVSYQWLREGSPIAKATDSTYTLAASDMFKTVSVKAIYKDLQGTNESVRSAESAKIAAPINHAPTGTVLIKGELLQNQTLSVTNNLADIDGIASDISYQWVINNSPVKGATQSTYLLTQNDVYKTVSVLASYTDKLGKLETVAGGVVQNENDKPTGNVSIDGTAKEGETLTIKNSIVDIDGMSGDFQYEWQADGVAFAEGEALTLTRAEVGKTISVAVQYTDNGGTFESVVSGATEKVLRLNTAPTGYVIVMGEQKNGVELSVLSTLADVDGLSEFSYQWLSGDTPINGATNSSYKLGLGDVGDRISVNVQYVDGYGTLESSTSSDTAAIQSSYVNGLILDSKDTKVVGTEKNDVLSGSIKTAAYSISALAGNDVVSGNDGNDVLDGGKGDDKILGGKGNDKLIGGDGNDTLKGGLGADTMQGGDGNDYYFIDDVKDVVSESNKNGRLGGNDTIESNLSYTLDKNIENLVLAGDKNINGTGNDFANELFGNSADNVLTGNAGNDDILGNKGADTLFGGEGEDVLDGGEGVDILNGDAGDDFLQGGESSDTLNGGEGSDVAIFNSSQADYQISRNINEDESVELVVKYIGSGINEGTDILNGIEMLKFGDDEAVNVSDVADTIIEVVGVAVDPAVL